MKNAYLLIILFVTGTLSGAALSCSFFPTKENSEGIAVINDRDYFQSVSEILSSANHSIHMIMFEIKYYPNYSSSNENKLLQRLTEAKKRGLDVKIVVDEYLTDKEAMAYLRDRGVNIKYDSPHITTHDKLIIVDKKIVIIGSTNWSHYALDKNREANVIIYSKLIAKEFNEYFKNVWDSS